MPLCVLIWCPSSVLLIAVKLQFGQSKSSSDLCCSLLVLRGRGEGANVVATTSSSVSPTAIGPRNSGC